MDSAWTSKRAWTVHGQAGRPATGLFMNNAGKNAGPQTIKRCMHLTTTLPPSTHPLCLVTFGADCPLVHSFGVCQ